LEIAHTCCKKNFHSLYPWNLLKTSSPSAVLLSESFTVFLSQTNLQDYVSQMLFLTTSWSGTLCACVPVRSSQCWLLLCNTHSGWVPGTAKCSTHSC